MALDYGAARVGMALGNTIARIANPSEVFQNDTDLMHKIRQAISQNNVDVVVVGLPRNMDGSVGQQAEHVLQFVEGLKNVVENDVSLQEETLSTVEAAQQFPNAPIDAAAAAIILQRYFDEQTYAGEVQ